LRVTFAHCLGSARVPRVWFRRSAETNFVCELAAQATKLKEKFAIANCHRQTRETHALPQNGFAQTRSKKFFADVNFPSIFRVHRTGA